ncbi:hypothetical protein FRC09_001710 [Ceratobasidium sp. 395]|nr:hypothetical protein FRC09_001710 [Ceratobasidium sp. 395]
MITELTRLLGLHDVKVVRRSNDRRNITPIVRKMKYTIKSLHDITFLIPLGLTRDSPAPPKFMLFMRSKKLCERAAKVLRSRLPVELQDRVVWVHAEMSSGFNERAMEKLKAGELFGVGIDIPDIDLVVQYQLPQKFCILFQRIGRAARGYGRTARVVIIADPRYFDNPTISAQKPSTGKGKKRKVEDEVKPSTRPTKKQRTKTHDHSAAIAQELLAIHDNTSSASPSTTQPSEDDQIESKSDIEPVMDAFINAEVRGSGCRRRAGNQYFANPDVPQAGDEEYCCPRCCPPPPPPEQCCDICNKLVVESTNALEDFKAPPRARPQTKIQDKDYEKWSNTDHGLREALCIWRDQAAEARWGPYHPVGGIGIIGDNQIDRIVSLARRGLIPNLSSFEREFKWSYFAQYAVDVLKIVHDSCPPPNTSQPPPTIPTKTQRAAPAPRSEPKKVMTCSGCGTPGHTCEYYFNMF